MTAFGILHPIFFFYHVALAHGFIPKFVYSTLGGLYGVTCGFVALIYVVFGHPIWVNALLRRELIFIFFGFYLLWGILWAAMHVALFGEPYMHLGAVKLLADFVLQLANFAIASHLILTRNRTFFSLIVICWASIVLGAFLNFEAGGNSVYHVIAQGSTLPTQGDGAIPLASYQGLSRSLLITSILLISLINLYAYRWIVIFASCLALIVIGGRSELIGFVIAVFALEICLGLASNRMQLKRLFVCTASLFLVIVTTSPIWKQYFLDVRIVNLYDVMSDASVITRLDQLSIGFDIVSKSPLFGSFAIHLKYGTHGDIPHSLLAVWTMLGFPGFVLMSVPLVYCLWVSVKANLTRVNPTAAWRFSFLMVIMTLPLLTIMKSGFVEWLPIVFGAVVVALKLDKQNGV